MTDHSNAWNLEDAYADDEDENEHQRRYKSPGQIGDIHVEAIMEARADRIPTAGREDNAGRYGFGHTRADGWTAHRQKLFLQAISEGHPVAHACRIVGMSKQSAYAFRRRAQGAAFAIAWDAATMLSRDYLADELMKRAIEGVRELVIRGDQVTERLRHDNRLALALLSRLDRMADRARGEVGQAAARLVATEFDAYLECLDRGPARAGSFLGARAEEATEADLAPIRSLARADRWLRTHTSLGDDIDISDLDPAQRRAWSDEQWRRAEAAGLVALAPEPVAPEPSANEDAGEKALRESQVGQLPQLEIGEGADVWWCDLAEEWRTRFPPPEGFDGDEDGDFWDEDYSRTLTPREEAQVIAQQAGEREALRAEDAAERDARFGFAGDAPVAEAEVPEPETETLALPAPEAP